MKASSRLPRAALVDQLLRRVARQHLARVHERDAVAAHPFVHEVRRHEDRDALLARQIDQQLPEAVARDRIDARGGLVEDQDLRLVQDGDGEREPLAQPHRQVLGQRIEVRAQPEPLDQLLDARLRLVRRQVIEARVQDQVLADASARRRARTPASCSRGSCGPPCCRPRPSCRRASRSLRWAASSPVSIFMVVDLPQPLEPRKPKISPRSIDSVTWSTAVKVPKRRVRPWASMAISVLPGGARRDRRAPCGPCASPPAAGR